jgi:LAS superfamily LD-carboxypeptidase LdcB
MFQLGIFSLIVACLGCGPEAQTGAVFSKYSAQPCAAPSPADTVPPHTGGNTSKNKHRDKLFEKKMHKPTSGVPSSRVMDPELSYLLGKFNPSQHPDFVAVGKPYTNRTGMVLRRETLLAFKKMWDAARKDGISLTIISSTRTFDAQKAIWENKWSKLRTQIKEPKDRALKILEYSSMPGTSRHHWGTDIDLNDLNDASFIAGGPHAKMYAWMQKHAAEYGFCQPYTAKNEDRPNGYNEEKWHWSYRPLADALLNQYEQNINDDMISGFTGAENAQSIGIVQNYVLGVACKK